MDPKFQTEIKAMLEESDALHQRAKDALGNGNPSQEQKQQADGWLDEAMAIRDRAGVMLKSQAKRDEISKFMDEPVREQMVDTKDADSHKMNGEQLEAELKNARSGMMKYLQHKGEMAFNNSLTPEERKTMSRLTDPAGGFFVNPEFSSQIIERLRNATAIRSRANVMTISSAELLVPVWDRNYTMGAVAEGGAVSAQAGDTAGQKRFVPKKREALLKITQELLADASFDVQGKLISMFTEQVGETEEPLFIEGDGGDEPTGILNGGITNTDISTATANTILPNDIQGLPFDLTAAYRARGVWVIPRPHMKEIMLLRENSDGANTGAFLWNNNWQTGKPPQLAGYEALETEYMTADSADGDALLFFGDLSKYTIVDRADISIQKLVELYALTGYIGLLFIKRMDAGVTDVNGFVRLNRT